MPIPNGIMGLLTGGNGGARAKLLPSALTAGAPGTRAASIGTGADGAMTGFWIVGIALNIALAGLVVWWVLRSMRRPRRDDAPGRDKD